MRVAGRSVWVGALILLMMALAGGAVARVSASASHRAEDRGQASTAAVQMQVNAGFGGYYRPNAWVPIRVQITNRGTQFSGVLRVDDAGQQAAFGTTPTDNVSYTRAVLMPQGGVKQVTLYVPGADLGSSVTIRLTGAGFPIQQTVVLNSLNLGEIFTGVLSRNPTLITQLRAGSLLDASVRPVALDAATLDSNPLALASFDLIVIGGFNSAELSISQVAALEAWVREGGTLVEIAGSTAQETVSSLTPALQIVHPGQPVTVRTLPGLAAAGGSALPPSQYVVAGGQISDGMVVLDQLRPRTATGPAHSPAVPLVVTAPLGMGTVVYSAVDPTLGPLASWSGLNRFWNVLAAQARSNAATTTVTMAGTQQTASQGGGIPAEIDNLSAPSFTLFIVLLAIYVLLLVPLNFIILGRLKRSDWSWVTLPALVVVLVGVTFGATYYNQGRDVRTSVVSMLYLTSGSNRVMAQHYVGIFAPVAGDYTLATGDAHQLGSPLFSTSQANSSSSGTNATAPAVQAAQDTGQVLLPGISMWSSRNAAFSGLTTFGRGLAGTLQFGANGHLAGTLTNDTSATLHSLVLAALGTYLPIPDLAPGRSYHVNWISGIGPSGSAPTQQTISDYLGGTAQVVSNHPGSGNVAQALGRYPVAALDGAALADLALSRMAAVDTIPTNPGESASQRMQNIVQQSLVNTSPSSFGQVVAIGWSAQPGLSFTVNGAQVNRQDTDMLIQSIPVALPDGRFTINSGSIPVRLAGSTSALQQGGFAGGGGFTINSQSDATFVGQLPLPAARRKTVRITSLTVDVYPGNEVGGTIGADTVSLYDWQHGRWVSIDASNGEVSPPDPARFVSAAGVIRAEVNATDSSIGLSDQNEGIAIGAAGEVQ